MINIKSQFKFQNVKIIVQVTKQLTWNKNIIAHAVSIIKGINIGIGY